MNIIERGGIRDVTSATDDCFVRVERDLDIGDIAYTDITIQALDQNNGLASLYSNAEGQSVDDETRTFLGLYGSHGAWGWTDRMPSEQELLSGLGYGYTLSEVEAPSGYKGQFVEYTAPSMQYWEKLIDRVPEHMASTRFAAFEGNEYSTFDAMGLFTENGTVQIATQRPERIHDGSDHPIGFFVLGQTYIEEVRRQAVPALERAAVEDELPCLGDILLYRQSQKDFLNPARAFIRELWFKIDSLSARLTISLCQYPEGAYKSLEDIVKDEVSSSFGSFTTEPPQCFIRYIEDDHAGQMAQEIMQRFELLKNLVQIDNNRHT